MQLSAIATRLFVLTVVLGTSFGFSQSTGGTGSIAGRITVNGKPASGMRVLLVPLNPANETDFLKLIGDSGFRTRCGEDGSYRLTDLPAGRYVVRPHAPAHVVAAGAFGGAPGEVTIEAGQALENVDFDLVPGGVITGRVIDHDGKPVIGARVSAGLDGKDSSAWFRTDEGQMTVQADDRGVYRVFGIPPGRYVVVAMSVGVPAFVGSQPTTAFHPGGSDRQLAKQVEVTSGSEATGIDIVMDLGGKGVAVRGRVVDSETGSPVPDGFINYYRQGRGEGLGQGLVRVNSKGEFTLQRVPRGTYTIMVGFIEDSQHYSSPETLQVGDQDVGDLVLRVKRGASITGRVVVEGLGPGDSMPDFTRIWVSALSQESKAIGPQGSQVSVDGTFRLGGIAPGNLRLMGHHEPDQYRLGTARVLRNGVDITDGFEVADGERIDGVHLVMTTATGSIRGRVLLQGGSLPPDWKLVAYVGTSEGRRSVSVNVDASGEFVAEDLLPGSYEIEVRAVPGSSERPPGSNTPSAHQSARVSGNLRSEVVIVLDITGIATGRGRQ